MAQFVRHSPCDNCGSRDNLACYDDGSSHCFGCGYHRHPNISSRIEARQLARCEVQVQETHERILSLPEDYDPFYFPLEALQWVAQYELTQQDLKRNRVGWSEKYHRLIFPFLVDNHLCAWQGRYFAMEEADKQPESEGRANRKVSKWLSRGRIHEFLYVLKSNTTSLIVVEDPLSAIKLQKFGYTASPLFGSQVTPTQKKCLLYSGFSDIILWLDRDKLSESYKYAKQLNELGFDCRVVSTEVDPKEIPHEQFKEVLK